MLKNCETSCPLCWTLRNLGLHFWAFLKSENELAIGYLIKGL
jgi:hypothetical protein